MKKILAVCLGLFTLDMTGYQIKAVVQAEKEPVYEGKPLSVWIKALQDQDAQVRLSAVAALGAIGPVAKDVVPALVGALKDKDSTVRLNVAAQLGDIGPEAKSAIPALIHALKDKDRSARSHGAIALGKITQETAIVIPALIEALQDKDGMDRASMATALGRFGPEAKSAVPPLIVALKNRSNAHWGERVQVVAAFGAIGPQAKAAVPALIEMLKDSEVEVRPAAAQALGKIGGEAKAAIPALTEALADQYSFVRPNAAVALWRIDPSQTAVGIPPMLELLKKQDTEIQLWAPRALGEIGPAAKDTIPALREALKDRRSALRMEVASAIWRIDPQQTEDAVAVLSDLLKDQYVEVQEMAALTLGDIGSSAKTAVPALVAATKNHFIKGRAIEALGKIGPAAKPAVPVLIDALNDGTRVISVPFDAFSRQSPGRHLEDPGRKTIKKCAAEALKKIDPDAAAKAGIR